MEAAFHAKLHAPPKRSSDDPERKFPSQTDYFYVLQSEAEHDARALNLISAEVSL